MISTKEMLRNILQDAKCAWDEFRFGVYVAALRPIRRVAGLPDMMFVKTKWNIALLGPDGQVKTRRKFFNLVTTAGLNHLADHLATKSVAYPMKYLAVGTGTTAAAAGDTALQTEIGTRVSGTQTNPSGAVYRVDGTFAAGNATGAITEAGILSASTVGSLFNRQVFSAINKAAGDSLQLTVDTTFSA